MAVVSGRSMLIAVKTYCVVVSTGIYNQNKFFTVEAQEIT